MRLVGLRLRLLYTYSITSITSSINNINSINSNTQ